MNIHIDAAEPTPRAQEPKCPEHPDATATSGFGLAGGGFGPYMVCDVCGRVFGKISEPIDEEEE